MPEKPAPPTFKPTHLLAGLIIVLIWGCNFTAVSFGLEEQPPLTLTFLRFAFSAIPMVFFVKRPELPWHSLAAYGISIFALQFTFLFSGMNAGVSAGLASVVLQLAVFITIGLATLFLGERPHPSQWVGALVAFLGVIYIASHQSLDATPVGLMLVLAGATFWASGNIIAKRFNRPVDALALVAWGSLFAAPFQFVVAFIVEGPYQMAASLESASWKTVGSVAYLAYLATLVGYGLWSWLMRLYPAATVAPLTLLVPIVAMTASALILDERMESWKLVGTALVIGGLCINMFGPRLTNALTKGLRRP